MCAKTVSDRPAVTVDAASRSRAGDTFNFILRRWQAAQEGLTCVAGAATVPRELEAEMLECGCREGVKTTILEPNLTAAQMRLDCFDIGQSLVADRATTPTLVHCKCRRGLLRLVSAVRSSH